MLQPVLPPRPLKTLRNLRVLFEANEYRLWILLHLLLRKSIFEVQRESEKLDHNFLIVRVRALSMVAPNEIERW